MMPYGIKLSTKHPSETKNNFENSFLKSIIFKIKIKLFYNIPLKIEIFLNHNNIGVKCFADIRVGMFLVQIDRQTLNILRNVNSAMYSK